MLWLVLPLKSIFKVILWCIYLLVCCGTSDLVYEVKLLHVCAYKVKEEKEDICRGTITLRLLNYGLQLLTVIGFSCCTIVNWLLECFPSLQALLQRTLNDYRAWDTILNQVVWKFVWFKARITFAIHKLHSKLKNSTKWVICGGAYLIIMLIWYNLALFIKRKCDFILCLSLSPSLHKQKSCCWLKNWSLTCKIKK